MACKYNIVGIRCGGERRIRINAKSRIIATPDGGELCIVEAGKPGGAPVLVHHGTPGSRLLNNRWIEDAQRCGIRLIGYDRPGYGGSTPRPRRSVASAAADAAVIAQELGLRRLTTWGVSGGGPHALACAALLPDLVAAAVGIASPAPYSADGLDWFAGMGEDNVVEFNAALAGIDAITQFVEASAAGLATATPDGLAQAFRSLLCPVDLAVLSTEMASFLFESTNEGLRLRRSGWIDDDIAFMAPWGFELSLIRVPVMLLHGAQDQFVPFSHGQWLAGKIPGVDARLSAEDGHLSLTARRIPEVHAWLLSKMA